MSAPSRPLLRWHGGKWRIAPWIIGYFPPHLTYVEPFGGAASVLLRKLRVPVEVLNDLDQTLVGLYRVLRDPASSIQLVEQLELTPFARAEFESAYDPSDDAIEQARRAIVRSYMGYGSDSTAGHYRTGFRLATPPVHVARQWAGLPDCIREVIGRLQGVVIECLPAAEIMERYDSKDTLHYVDPPYLGSTRCDRNQRRRGPGRPGWHVYTHELTDADHCALLDQLRGLSGGVILSGYPSALYDDALSDWHRVERIALADGARRRTEVIWLNPSAASGASQRSMLAA